MLDTMLQREQAVQQNEMEKSKQIEAAQNAVIAASSKTSVGCRVDELIGSTLPTCISAWSSILAVLLIQSIPNLVRLLKKMIKKEVIKEEEYGTTDDDGDDTDDDTDDECGK